MVYDGNDVTCHALPVVFFFGFSLKGETIRNDDF